MFQNRMTIFEHYEKEWRFGALEKVIQNGYFIFLILEYRKPSLNLPWATISSPPEQFRELASMGYYY